MNFSDNIHFLIIYKLFKFEPNKIAMTFKTLILITFITLSNFVFSQKIELVNPPNWWTNMENPNIEILLKGKNISQYEFFLEDTKAVLTQIDKYKNPNYVSLTLDLSKIDSAEKISIRYQKGNKKFKYVYDIKNRISTPNLHKGINPGDLIYLITPDRFANGNPENDSFSDMKQTIVKRDSIIERHGGDLQGVINHLDYIKDLGMTAVWLNPVEENDQKFQSYHGYAFTDNYLVDKRFGSMQDYKNYVDKSHEMGLKVVKDVVFNHIGNEHILWKEAPDADWFHPQQQNNYRATALMDPYASDYDKNLQQNGWFADVMPDLNQKNPHVSKYLIQYALWWIEEFGLDAYRVDTFSYSDETFLWEMLKEIKKQYPQFTVFSEVWDTGEPTQAFFDSNRLKNPDKDTKDINIGITDFELQYALVDMCNEKTGWNTGLSKIYYTLAYDYIYKNPNLNVTFLDNHDIDRYLGTIKNNVRCFKEATAVLLTTRGIPQWFYGDEILFNQQGHHGKIRADFPGGWPSDKENKFTELGRTPEENDFFNYLKTIANWRKNSKAISEGKLKQFVPQDNVYVFFRYNEQETVMTIINKNTEEYKLDLKRFEEMLKGKLSAKDIISGQNFTLDKNINLPAETAMILEIK